MYNWTGVNSIRNHLKLIDNGLYIYIYLDKNVKTKYLQQCGIFDLNVHAVQFIWVALVIIVFTLVILLFPKMSVPCKYDALVVIQHLTHWGRVTHICVSELTIIGSDSGLSPGRGQAIIWTNAGVLLIGPLGTNFSEILIEIHIIKLKKMHLKMSSGNGGHFVSASMS